MQKFTPKEYLKIDIASNFGLDKLTWNERISWFNEHENDLLSLIKKAKEPALYYAGVKAWEATLKGEPTGYMISLDATSSGLQLLACLTGDKSAAALCNVVDHMEDGEVARRDAYTVIYNAMLAKIMDTAKISRDDVKDAIMTAFYSSRAVPKKIFGEGKLLDVFYETVSELAPGAWDLNEAMLGLWNSEALSHDWVLPDNFHVHIAVVNQVKEVVNFLNAPYDVFYKINAPIENGRSLGANMTHSLDGMIVREVTRRCDYDPKKVAELYEAMSGSISDKRARTNDDKMVLILWDHYKRTGYLSARIIDHLNPDNLGHIDRRAIRELLDSLPKKPFKVISVHDCFRCHPNYGNDLREQYNRQLMLIAKSSILGDIISQIIGRPIKIGKLDDNMWKSILNTNYSLS